MEGGGGKTRNARHFRGPVIFIEKSSAVGPRDKKAGKADARWNGNEEYWNELPGYKSRLSASSYGYST